MLLSPESVEVKPNTNYLKVFQKVLDDARFQVIIEKLVQKAESGDFKSQRLVIEQAQGKPTQRIEVTQKADQALLKIQQLLAQAGQPVEWEVVDEKTVIDAPAEDDPED